MSVVTAMKENVEKGKVIVGPDGEPITGELELTGTAADSQVLEGQTYYNTNLHQRRTGSMVNQGAWESSGLAAGSSVVIPPGYHNGAGKVTAKDLASQTPGDVTAAQIWTGKKAWVNGKQITGTLATQGGSTTIPGTAAKTIVTPNKIVTGNIAVAGDANLVAGNIKKNVTIFGVKGICEGWFPTATDLYLNGVDPAGFSSGGGSSSITYDGLKITIPQNKYSYFIEAANSYNFVPYTKLNIDMQYTANSLNTDTDTGIYLSSGGSGTIASLMTGDRYAGRYTFSLDITNVGITVKPRISFNEVAWYGAVYIYHIWLS